MDNQTGFLFAGESIVGLVRRHNEDNFLIAAPKERRTALAVVADGVGGNRHGEIASYICCRDFGAAFMKTSDADLQTPEQGKQFLADAMEQINKRIFAVNFADRTPSPMSSTIVVLLLTESYGAVLNVGDSRLYRIAGAALEQLSVDHTMSGDPEVAWLREKSSRFNPHTLSRSVGSKKVLNARIESIKLTGKESFCLCSDGFYNELTPEQLREILTAETANPRQILDRAMRQVLLAGAHDNATAICCMRRRT